MSTINKAKRIIEVLGGKELTSTSGQTFVLDRVNPTNDIYPLIGYAIGEEGRIGSYSWTVEGYFFFDKSRNDNNINIEYWMNQMSQPIYTREQIIETLSGRKIHTKDGTTVRLQSYDKGGIYVLNGEYKDGGEWVGDSWTVDGVFDRSAKTEAMNINIEYWMEAVKAERAKALKTPALITALEVTPALITALSSAIFVYECMIRKDIETTSLEEIKDCLDQRQILLDLQATLQKALPQD